MENQFFVGASVKSNSKYSKGLSGIVWRISDYGVHVKFGTDDNNNVSFQVFHFKPTHHMQTDIKELEKN